MAKKPTSNDQPIQAADDAAEKQARVIPLRVFRVAFADRPDETVMAHHMTFPHPREVLFVDVIVDGGLVSQYNRRWIYGAVDVSEITPSADMSTERKLM